MLDSIRGRLTLWLALLIALCTALFALFVYLSVADVALDDLDQTLRIQAQQVAAAYSFGAPVRAGETFGRSGVEQFATAGVVVEAVDAQGRVLARSTTSRGRPLPRVTPVPARPRVSTDEGPGSDLRVYRLPVRRGAMVVGGVVVAASLQEVDATMRRVLGELVAGGLAVVAVAAVGGFAVVRGGLRPLDRMTAVAEDMTASRLDRRLELRRPPREVGRLADAFNAMLDRLDEAFAAQRRFVADASHELRTPIAVIHGRSEVLLLDPALADETRAGLALVRDEAGRMGRLVANLLLLARGDVARTIDQRPVALDVVLREVAWQARLLAKGVAITIVHKDQVVVRGDADLLKQLLLNLVDNAIAYTPPGGRVEIALAAADGAARLSISDTGPGIAPEDLERIFARFARLDHARTRQSGGAGLGLAIARWIAEAHGGRIAVESVVGQGSTFTVLLPLSDHTLTVL